MTEILLVIGFFTLLAGVRLWTHRDKIFSKEDRDGLYYVYNPYGNGPKYIHDSYESALNEAKRLHDKHPRFSFEVLKIVQIIEADSGYELISEDEIPF